MYTFVLYLLPCVSLVFVAMSCSKIQAITFFKMDDETIWKRFAAQLQRTNVTLGKIAIICCPDALHWAVLSNMDGATESLGSSCPIRWGIPWSFSPIVRHPGGNGTHSHLWLSTQLIVAMFYQHSYLSALVNDVDGQPEELLLPV